MYIYWFSSESGYRRRRRRRRRRQRRTTRATYRQQAVINCMLDIQRWSNSRRQKVDAAKSGVIWLGTTKVSLVEPNRSHVDRRQRSPAVDDGREPCGVHWRAFVHATNARNCAKIRYFLLRRIRQLCRYVDYDTLYTLIRALIQYCHAWDYRSSFCGSRFSLHRLQRVQDAAARLLWCSSSNACATSSETALGLSARSPWRQN